MNSSINSLKTALITGAGSGIGQATAQLFSRNGFEVLLVGRREEQLRNVGLSLVGPYQVYSCDLSSPAAASDLVSSLFDSSNKSSPRGDLQVLINNAGQAAYKSLEESGDDVWQNLLNINLMAPVRLSRALIPHLKKRGGGVIVNVGSTVGMRPVASLSAYSATKAALVSFTKSLALELAPYQIRANCVNPGAVDTDMPFQGIQGDKRRQVQDRLSSLHPLGRIGKPAEVAQAIYYFCAVGAEWTTGSILNVDGGISL